MKQDLYFLASNSKHTQIHTPAIVSIVIHLIHPILITVPVCGKWSLLYISILWKYRCVTAQQRPEPL